MNKRIKFELYSHTTIFSSLCVLLAFYFLKLLLNDIFYLTYTDIFASFICEMLYKRHIYENISEEMLDAPQENYCCCFTTLIC